MSKKPCLDCGVVTENSRCPTHTAISAAKYERIRGTPTERGYDNEWRKVRLEILKRDRWTCYLCGKQPLEGADATVDHVVPLSVLKNEARKLRHDPSLLRACCRKCNSSKGNK